MYAAIRQGKAKTGMAEELARRIKEGAIPIISDVEGFMAYYVVYAPDDTVTAISIFNNYAGAEESNRRAVALDRAKSCAAADRAGHRGRRAGDRAHIGLRIRVGNSALSSLSRTSQRLRVQRSMPRRIRFGREPRRSRGRLLPKKGPPAGPGHLAGREPAIRPIVWPDAMAQFVPI